MAKAGRKLGLDLLADAQRAEFVALCRAGATVKQLADRFGEHESVIKRWRKALGFQANDGGVAQRNRIEQEVFRAFQAAGATSDFAAAKQTVGAILLTAEYLAEYLIERFPITIDTLSPESRVAAALELLGELSEEPLPEHEAEELRLELARLVSDPERMNSNLTDDPKNEGDSLMRSAERLRRQMVRQVKDK